jgi:NADH dehydrogenase/NADH:ubiquinone oxidoreductase subunit G
MFPLAGVVNEDYSKSDHRPILINTELNTDIQQMSRRGPLRFEARWLCEDSVEHIFQTAWNRAKQLHAESSLSERTKQVHDALHQWDKDVLNGPRKKLRELQKDLNEVMSGPLTEDAVAKQKEIQLRMENLLEQEEIYWIQRGRVNWLHHGDQNTAFFHRSATARRKRNFIKSLKNDAGDTIDNSDQLLSLAAGHFENLFTSDVLEPDQTVIDKVCPCVSR